MAMEWPDFFLLATCTLGFISLFKPLIHCLRWVWVMFLRPPKNLKDYGSWAIITGSTDGIGKALAFELASKRLNILLAGRNPQKLEATMKEIRDRHGGNVDVKFLVMDLENVNGEEMIKRIEEATKGLDVGILINNAGMAEPYPRFFHENDSELVDAIIKVNLEGPTWVTKAVLPGMIEKKKGAIINIGSGSSVVVPSYPLFTTYAATKAYFAMFSRCISLEYKAEGIDIQCQVPQFVSTKMTKMRASLFVPSPETYSKASTRCIGYDSLCVPYSFHSLQCLLIRTIPHPLVNCWIMRFFLDLRKRALLKDSKKTH